MAAKGKGKAKEKTKGKGSQETSFRATDYLFYYMWHIVTESQRKIEEAIRPYGIKSPGWRVISMLHDKQSMSASELSKEVLIESSRISRIIKTLEEDNIVCRERNAEDQRYTRVELTDKGNQLFEAIAPIVERQLESTLQGLSKEDRANLDQMMRTMKDNAYLPAFATPFAI